MQLVFRCEYLLIPSLRECVPHDAFALIRTEDHPYGFVVALLHHLSGVIVHIHLHLAHILMSQVTRFEVYQDKAFQTVVVKDQVNVEVASVEAYPFLAGLESEASAQFKKEFLDVR